MDIPCTQEKERGHGNDSLLAFRAIARSDVDELRVFSRHFRQRLCEFTPGNLYFWRDEFDNRMVIEDGLLYVRQHFRAAGVTAYCYPQGPEPERHAGVDRLLAHSRALGEPSLRLGNVSDGELELLRGRYAVLSARAERDWFDYLYDAAAFASMAGRRYAGQRNHINQFLRAFPDWRYEPFGPDNRADVRAFLETFYETRGAAGILREERVKLFEALDDPAAYSLSGGLIRGAGRVLALSAGERVGDTLFVHIEKADLSAPGAYPMMAREFVRRNAAPDTLFVNREEDAGVEGLRVSKLSYHPVKLLEKYTVELGRP